MVKSVKDLPFSITQKISKKDSIVWLKASNRYIILNSNILELIRNKLSLSLKDFLSHITESLNVSSKKAERINEDISELLLEAKEEELKLDIKHPESIKSCKLIEYYSFNNIIIKVCFDSEQTKSLIHQKYSHLVINNVKVYDFEYSIFNSSKNL